MSKPVEQLVGNIVFIIFIAITLIGAVMAVGLKSIFHNALSLALALFGTAGIFIFLRSEFVALIQVLIYAGAISIAIIFAIMLSPALSIKLQKRKLTKFLGASSISALIFVSFVWIFNKTPWNVSNNPDVGDYSLVHLGETLITKYAFAFELISIVLLVSVLGALVIASEKEKAPTQE